MNLSVIVPTTDGRVPQSLRDQVADRDDVELVAVTGVSPVGRARNEGLRRATGEYVAWVDSDDEVAADWLAEILKALADGSDVVTIDAELVGWEAERRDFVWGVPEREVTVDRLLRDVYRDIVRPSSLWLYVTRRRLWKGLSFDETARVAEDYLVLPHVLARAKTCRYLPQRLYRYVRNPNSLINTQTAELDASVIGLWSRRLAECPPDYRGACRWGFCVSAYWVCCRLALEPQSCEANDRANAKRCRRIIVRSLPLLLWETLSARSLSVSERAGWFVRFATAALNIWNLQRFRHRRCRA